MIRVCQWCRIPWEASRLDPDPYFCPRCEDKRTVWERLRGGETDGKGAAGETFIQTERDETGDEEPAIAGAGDDQRNTQADQGAGALS